MIYAALLPILLIIVLPFGYAALLAFGMTWLARGGTRRGIGRATFSGGLAELAVSLLADAANPTSGFKTIEGEVSLLVAALVVFAVLRRSGAFRGSVVQVFD